MTHPTRAESATGRLLGRMMGFASLGQEDLFKLTDLINDAATVEPTLWERLRGRLNGKTSLRHELVLSRLRRLSLPVQPSGRCLAKPFILRVDDFPHAEYSVKDFLRFHEIVMGHEVRYFLGVTPFLHPTPMIPGEGLGPGLSPEEKEALRRIGQETDIALHGFSHRTIDCQPPSELAGLTPVALERLVERCLEVLGGLDLEAHVFIPPFNTFRREQVPLLARHFSILCGGPESLHHVGFRVSPSLLDGLLYLPSYPPAYAQAQEVLEFARRLRSASLPSIVPLTVHWAWEVEDDFRALDSLCAEIGPRTTSVLELLDGHRSDEQSGKSRR